jgi:5'-nucleotidase
MSYLIENKLVIAIASSALFDLSKSDRVFREEGEEKYKSYQREHKDIALEKGVAFAFIRRFLNLNTIFIEEQPVEVILLSRNTPETGLRVFNSIKHHGLAITRAAFLSGKSPYPYIPAFNVSLFLSANPRDVKQAIDAHYPAGMIMPSEFQDDESDKELRVAFDFDGVLIDDEPESVFQKNKNLDEFHAAELSKVGTAHNRGPLNDLFMKLSWLQQLEKQKELLDNTYKRVLRTAIVTARSAPAHERVVTTLSAWGVEPDETFFLGGIEKARILEILKPHIFFDDQRSHLTSSAKKIPSVHIPFGIANN